VTSNAARILVLSALGLSVLGCSPKAARVLKPIDVGRYAVIEPTSGWALVREQFTRRYAGRVFTVDGEQLNTLQVVGGLKATERLRINYGNRGSAPVWPRGGKLEDAPQFILDTLRGEDIPEVAETERTPVSVGMVGGLRFEFHGTTERGLEMTGLAVCSVVSGRLVAAVYTAPSEYYHPLRAEAARQALASFQVRQ